MKIGCHVCSVPVLELVQMSPTVHQVKTLENHANTVGTFQFCKEHVAEALEYQRSLTFRGKRVLSEEEQESMKKAKVKPEKSHDKADKAVSRYSVRVRWGLSHECSGALMDLRKKLNSSGFEAVAELYSQVGYELEKHEAEIADRLVGKDTKERKYYKSVHGV